MKPLITFCYLTRSLQHDRYSGLASCVGHAGDWYSRQLRQRSHADDRNTGLDAMCPKLYQSEPSIQSGTTVVCPAWTELL